MIYHDRREHYRSFRIDHPGTRADLSANQPDGQTLVESFGQMAIDVFVAPYDDVATECLSCGLSWHERREFVFTRTLGFARSAQSRDPDEVFAYVQGKLRESAVDLWLRSHHRN